ncbi:MAG: MATE family efflux transporter [Lachnospiraceae bacterium]|nr:MATE family efflux transporter [Lachnospiraceae bacterium]
MTQKAVTSNRITEGSVPKGILLYFLPIFFGSMFQQLYNTVDAIIVGKFVGTEALGAVGGSSGQISGIVFNLLIGIASGATVTVAQHFGAGNLKKVREDIHNSIAMAVIGSVFMMVLIFLLCRPILRWMSTPEELMDQSVSYILVLFISLPVAFLFHMGSGILRALGDSKRPLYYLIVCCFVNIALDLLFVALLKLGVVGAAIATDVSQLICVILVLIRLKRLPEEYRLDVKTIKIYPDVMKAQLRIGLPGGFSSSLYGIANIIIQTAINVLGTATVAAHAAFVKIDSFYWLVNSAFGIAVTTFVGQNYGAGKQDRVRESTLWTLVYDIAGSLVIAAVVFFGGSILMRLFSDSEEVISIGVRIARTVCPYYFMFCFIEILSGSLRGHGNVVVPTVLTLSGICALRVLWIFFIVPLNPALENVMVVFPISWGVTAVLFIIYYLYDRNKRRRKQAKKA